MENMSNSLPTVSQLDPTTYGGMAQNNKDQMEAVFKQFFPDFPEFAVPFDDVFRILYYLEETKVNPEILPRVIRGVNNILLGTGRGTVIVHVTGPITTVEARERDPQEVQSRKVDTQA